jgi:ATP synthase protein I
MNQPSPDDIDPKRDADSDADRMAHAARQAVRREREALEEPEPSLGTRLGQIGILGWTIVVPTLDS